MLKILKNMTKYWLAIIIIIVFLFVQAICDLALPSYTSGLIDVGIQKSGIEYAVPTVISADKYKMVSSFMLSDEIKAWTDSYSDGGDGKYYLSDDIAVSDEKLLELDKTFTEPLAIIYMMTQKSQSSEDDGMDMSQLITSDSGESVTIEEVRAKIDTMIESVGDSILHSSAVSLIISEYKALGIDTGKIQTGYLSETGLRMLGMALLMAAAAVIVGFFSSRVGAGIGRDLRKKIFSKVIGFSEREMNHFSTASLITRTTNDIQQVQMVSIMLLRMVFYSPIMAIGGILMVIRSGAKMEWIIFIAVAAILCVVGSLMAIAMPKFKLMQTLVDKVNLISREILTGLSVIRAFGREDTEEKRFDDSNRELTKTMLFTNRVMTFMMPIMMLIMNGISILIVWVSSHKIEVGTLEVGAMTAFITYTMMIVMSFLMFTMVSVMLPRAIVAAGRINEIIETEVTITDAVSPKALPVVSGSLRFENVSFKYPGAEDDTLSGITFETLPGKITAVIGSTGSGKSTLVQLIPRFYDVTEGRILLDGVDIRDIPQKTLRENIGYVPQKGVLFSGTIESNIKYSSENISDAEMIEAAEIAQSEDFINAKTEKYQSPVAQGGSNVSGGQKQRLSIARAIAKNPKIYVFDDSFSALDFKTDSALRRALAPKMKTAATIIVAQRISTVLHADNILVLEDGVLAGSGTHEQLMQSCEVYRQIATSQLSEKELSAGYKAESAKGEVTNE